MLRRHLNFCQFFYRFTLNCVNPYFQYLSGSHIMYWNIIISNPSRFKVEPHSKYCFFWIERWDLLSLRFSENAVVFHIEWVCRKPAGNRPTYRYTAVTYWAYPPSYGDAELVVYPLFWRDRPITKVAFFFFTITNFLMEHEFKSYY